ncbi:hypothetical protein BD311DRAFT_766519 [Dichomitus squalens]|uniref:Uncharacterized protein n=1 Tax=Dichomitus squalens TaxID=114155 RepID=A0A4Q9MEH6_9APHY|nr:hypothetical protein BD311DRAFT_766519 [Dichomitus squalens]
MGRSRSRIHHMVSCFGILLTYVASDTCLVCWLAVMECVHITFHSFDVYLERSDCPDNSLYTRWIVVYARKWCVLRFPGRIGNN